MRNPEFFAAIAEYHKNTEETTNPQTVVETTNSQTVVEIPVVQDAPLPTQEAPAVESDTIPAGEGASQIESQTAANQIPNPIPSLIEYVTDLRDKLNQWLDFANQIK